MKVLVAVFSAEGRTGRIAGQAAAHKGWDCYEIQPVKPYTKADIRWTNPLSRCNREKFGKKVALFATSGGSGIGKTKEKLQPFVKGAGILDAILVSDGDDLVSYAEKVFGV